LNRAQIGGDASARPSSGDSLRYITATDARWPVDSVRGSDPLGAGAGGFKDSENCLGIGGEPVMLPCVASSVAVTPPATRCRPPGDFTLTAPVKTRLPFAAAAVFGVKANW